jgi:hypothetical protein
MCNKISRHAIEKDLSRRSGQQSTDHVTLNLSKPQFSHDFDKKGPGHRIKSFGDIQLEENAGLFVEQA